MNRLAAAMVLSGAIMAVSHAARADEFEFRQYKDAAGHVLPYRLLKPEKYDPSQKYPVLICLHGAGERGDNNVAQLGHFKKFIETASKKYPCFVIVPQCPQDRRWVEVDWSAFSHTAPDEPSVPLRGVMAVLAGLQKEYSIDADRIYAIGLSMGGYGTWDLLTRYPAVFAAGVPICGGGDLNKAPLLANKGVWAFHGGSDPTVPVQRSRFMIEVIKARGGNPRYTEYPGVGHGSWGPAMRETELADWLFSQRLNQPTTASAVAPAAAPTTQPAKK